MNFSKGFSCTKVNLGLFLRRRKERGWSEAGKNREQKRKELIEVAVKRRNALLKLLLYSIQK